VDEEEVVVAGAAEEEVEVVVDPEPPPYCARVRGMKENIGRIENCIIDFLNLGELNDKFQA